MYVLREQVLQLRQICQVHSYRISREDLCQCFVRLGIRFRKTSTHQLLVARHQFVDQHIGEHGLEGIALPVAQDLGQKSYSIEELASIKQPIITLTVIILSTCLFECRVEYFDSELIRYHTPLDGKLNELCNVH